MRGSLALLGPCPAAFCRPPIQPAHSHASTPAQHQTLASNASGLKCPLPILQLPGPINEHLALGRSLGTTNTDQGGRHPSALRERSNGPWGLGTACREPQPAEACPVIDGRLGRMDVCWWPPSYRTWGRQCPHPTSRGLCPPATARPPCVLSPHGIGPEPGTHPRAHWAVGSSVLTPLPTPLYFRILPFLRGRGRG